MKFTLKSKTHVFGVIVAIFGALLAALPEVRGLISEEHYGFIFMVISAITVFFRNITSQSIHDK